MQQVAWIIQVIQRGLQRQRSVERNPAFIAAAGTCKLEGTIREWKSY